MRGCKNVGRVLVCSFLLLLLRGLPVQGEPIVILYDSFESPVLGEDEGFSAQIDPPGWVRETTGSEQLYTRIWNEGLGYFSTPYGSQVLAIWRYNTVTTTNITDRLQPGVTYTLTFNAGNARDNSTSSANTYKAEILAGTNVIAEVSAQTDTRDMSEQGMVSIQTDGDHPHLGEIIGVRFQHAGGGWEWRTLIDNVLLVAEETDEFQHTLFIGK